MARTDCAVCDTEVPESLDKCPTCGEPAGAPNVRSVGSSEEKASLEIRYQEACEKAHAKGLSHQLTALESALERSIAVVATALPVVRQLITSDQALYSGYFIAVNANFRKPASVEDDRNRRVVDGLLFDGFGDRIVFAALSVDGTGLTNYGRYTITLRDVSIAKRATVLEENSFAFVKKRGALFESLPRGYQAIWSERKKVGIAKLADRMSASTSAADIPSLVLKSGKTRELDDFIEVHIYGTFDGGAIESIAGPATPSKGDERATVRVVKEHLTLLGKKWIDR